MSGCELAVQRRGSRLVEVVVVERNSLSCVGRWRRADTDGVGIGPVSVDRVLSFWEQIKENNRLAAFKTDGLFGMTAIERELQQDERRGIRAFQALAAVHLGPAPPWLEATSNAGSVLLRSHAKLVRSGRRPDAVRWEGAGDGRIGAPLLAGNGALSLLQGRDVVLLQLYQGASRVSVRRWGEPDTSFKKLLATLPPHEARHILQRTGMNQGGEPSFGSEAVVNTPDFETTRERIRQIEAKALRKLRSPARSKRLRAFLDSANPEDE